MFVIGGVVIYNFIINTRSVSLASFSSIPTSTTVIPTPTNPTVIATPTVDSIPTEVPTPTTPLVTIIPVLPELKTQILKATYGPPLGLDPTEFSVKTNIPVRLEVYATANGRGCMGSITIPEFTRDIQVFTEGQTNIFEFTPQTPGTYDIACAMGIPHGYITVE